MFFFKISIFDPNYIHISIIYWKGMWGYMKTFWPNCVSRKSRKLDEIHISYKVEKPVLVAMLTHRTPKTFSVWFYAFKNKSDTFGMCTVFPWIFTPLIIFYGRLFIIFYIYLIQKKSTFFCVLYHEAHQVVSKFLQVYQILAKHKIL